MNIWGSSWEGAAKKPHDIIFDGSETGLVTGPAFKAGGSSPWRGTMGSIPIRFRHERRKRFTSLFRDVIPSEARNLLLAVSC
jgi:hypothetical protein